MKPYQVVGIGNAMVDVLARCDDAFLDRHGVEKGIMQLIDLARGAELYGLVGPATEVSGGSNANAIAAIAHLGGRTAYVGKVRDDVLGHVFADDLRAQGADYATPMASADHPAETGRCIVLVTPDGERSMNTYLGVTEFLAPSDIDEVQLRGADWVYLEGYRFDGPGSHAAFAKAIRATRGAGGKVALTLSDPFCVGRHSDAFATMIAADVDLLFCNRAELLAMFGDDFEAGLAAAAGQVALLACTDGANGAHVLAGGKRWHVPATPVDVIDATGAGDLFAGAFLWGLSEGYAPDICGRMGCLAAAEVITHIGARPAADLRAMFRQAGLTEGA